MKKKTEKNDKSIYSWVLAFAWLLFILLALVFYFYFKDELKLFGKKDSENSETTQELDEEFKTIYTYETNSNLDINALICDYYFALSSCNQELLQSLVTSPELFDDMTTYEHKAQVITHYSNINCYTMPGYTDDTTVVYVTSNLTITGVDSHPLDICQFYVIKDENSENGYKIYNNIADADILNYISTQNAHEDVQALYQSVKNNIDQCIASDPTFAEFYNKINETE